MVDDHFYELIIRLINPLSYGSIAAYMIHRAFVGLTSQYVKFFIGVHFTVVLIRTVVILLWRDSPNEWKYIHAATAAICMCAVFYYSFKRTPHD